jgi:hypothetical protein
MIDPDKLIPADILLLVASDLPTAPDAYDEVEYWVRLARAYLDDTDSVLATAAGLVWHLEHIGPNWQEVAGLAAVTLARLAQAQRGLL